MDTRTCYIFMILLQQEDYITSLEIVDLLEREYDFTCDKKSVAASIKLINSFYSNVFGIEEAIQSIKKKGSKFNQSILEYEQLQFLYDSLLSNNSISTKEGNTIFETLTQIIPTDIKNRVVRRNEADSRGSSGLNALFSINKAIKEKRALKFDYVFYEADDHNRIHESYRSYTVSPYDTHMQDGRYYLICYYDNHKDGVTTFRIDRMKNVKSSSKSLFINRIDEIDIDQPKKSVNMFASTKHIDELELECQRRMLRTVVDQFGENIKITKTNDPDRVNVIIQDTYDSTGLIGWLMMLSPGIKVIGPESVVNEMKATLEQTAKNYHI